MGKPKNHFIKKLVLASLAAGSIAVLTPVVPASANNVIEYKLHVIDCFGIMLTDAERHAVECGESDYDPGPLTEGIFGPPTQTTPPPTSPPPTSGCGLAYLLPSEIFFSPQFQMNPWSFSDTSGLSVYGDGALVAEHCSD
ncbi:MAG TPA: hypothetical protein ENJ68_02610 [Devosia sp.]|nr:hypothetical protein [Devosia sp.]